jgi:hypothetical protein
MALRLADERLKEHGVSVPALVAFRSRRRKAQGVEEWHAGDAMRHMTADARDTLVTAQEVARLRDAVQVEVRDIALAVLILHALRASQAVDGSGAPSHSPEQLPMADEVREIMTSGEGDLRNLDLVALARREESELSDYLGPVWRAIEGR